MTEHHPSAPELDPRLPVKYGSGALPGFWISMENIAGSTLGLIGSASETSKMANIFSPTEKTRCTLHFTSSVAPGSERQNFRSTSFGVGAWPPSLNDQLRSSGLLGGAGIRTSPQLRAHSQSQEPGHSGPILIRSTTVRSRSLMIASREIRWACWRSGTVLPDEPCQRGLASSARSPGCLIPRRR